MREGRGAVWKWRGVWVDAGEGGVMEDVKGDEGEETKEEWGGTGE